VQREPDLLEVVRALQPAGDLPRRLHRRQHERDEAPDESDDDRDLDQGETAVRAPQVGAARGCILGPAPSDIVRRVETSKFVIEVSN
jgi:hypothetical protein